MLVAIRNIEQDGLTPADYHLSAITAALDAYTKAPSPEVTADLHVLIADAAVAMVDDVCYGRVRPSSLDRRWNVDPRTGAPALDLALAEVARAASIDAGIEAQKPTHFIYAGLKQALARMRSTAKAGGWPVVTSGAAIKPGATDPRVAMVSKRLLVTGELANATSTTDAVYGDELLGAVRSFQAHHRLTEDGVIGKATIDAMNISAEARAQQLRVNLERARWVVGGLERHVRARQSSRLQGLPDSRSKECLGSAHADRARSAADADVPRRHEVPGAESRLDRAADDPRARMCSSGHAQGSGHDRASKRPDDPRSAGPRRRPGVDRLAERDAWELSLHAAAATGARQRARDA